MLIFWEPLIGCWKTVLPAQHTALAVLAVGLRQKALPQRFLIATTASKVFLQPSHIRLPFVALGAKEGVHPRNPRQNVCFRLHGSPQRALRNPSQTPFPSLCVLRDIRVQNPNY